MLDPAAFQHTVEAYLDSLTTEELRSTVLRSVRRMDGAHRAQLALFLGHDVGGDPIDDVGGSSVQENELRTFIDSCGLLRERFNAFLRENPRAVRALDRTAVDKIFSSWSERLIERDGDRRRSNKLSPKTAAIIAVAIALAVLPLVAQYAHQRGMIAGLDQVSMAPPIAAPVPKHTVPVREAVQRRTAPHVASVRKPRKATRVAAAVPGHQRVHHTAPRHVAYHRAAPVRHKRSVAWKFDPQYNPYLNHHGWHATSHAAAAMYLPANNEFASRAALLVSSYLAAVIAGHTGVALQHLGLSANADTANLREMPIVSRSSHARVIAVRPQADGSAKVEVDINGRSGEYFEVFYVAQDGWAARIKDRYYIPVDRTAEERAARLLANDGH